VVERKAQVRPQITAVAARAESRMRSNVEHMRSNVEHMRSNVKHMRSNADNR
jgi:hypothetical protein